jgi:hypothetical protein
MQIYYVLTSDILVILASFLSIFLQSLATNTFYNSHSKNLMLLFPFLMARLGTTQFRHYLRLFFVHFSLHYLSFNDVLFYNTTHNTMSAFQNPQTYKQRKTAGF